MVSVRTLVNAVIGAIVAVILSFLPISPAIGGAVSGFLEGPDGREGAIAGTVAGLIMFVPLAGIGLVVLTFFGFGMGVGVVPASGALVLLFLSAFILFVFFVPIVGLSLLGGVLGAYVAREYPDRHANARELIGMDERSRRSHEPGSVSRGTPRGDGHSEPERSESDTSFDRDQPPISDPGRDDRTHDGSKNATDDSDPVSDRDERYRNN